MLKNYLKIALRTLSKNKVYTVINVLGLSIGICACLVIYLIAHFELSFDTFHQDRERIYRVVSDFTFSGESYHNSGVPTPVPVALREELTGLETVSGFYTVSLTAMIPNGNNSVFKDVKSVIADPQYFQIFKYEWLEGNPETALNEPFKVVLSEGEARKYFGNINQKKIIGKTIDFANYSDTVKVTVSGIVKKWDQNSDFVFENFISFSTIKFSTKWKENYSSDSWTNTNGSSQTLIKLAKNTDISQIRTQLLALHHKHVKDEPNSKSVLTLQPLSDIHFNPVYGGDFMRVAHLPTLYALMGIAVFLLLIATINFVNLATAQSIQRAKEIGVRKVLGSSRGNLIFQFLSETFVISLLAVILSLLIANPVLYLFKSFIPEGVVLEIFNLQNLTFLVFVLVATSLLSGFYPSWVLSSYQPVETLKNQVSSKSSRKSYLRQVLIVFQFTISLVFIIGTMIVGKQIQYMLNKDMGFDKDAIISFRTHWRFESSKKLVLAEKMRQIPEVKQVSISQSTPAENGYSTTTIDFKEGGKDISTNVHRKSGDENYIGLYGIKLIAGRNIRNSDTLREVLINETYAKILGFARPQDAVNHNLTRDKMLLPIVGVVADFHVMSLREAVKPLFIGSENKYTYVISAKLNTKDQEISSFKSTLAKIEKNWNEMYPNEKFEYEFFDETVAKFYNGEQKTAKVMSIATTVAILISCMGLFGLVAFTTNQRTKEIGIRKVLGASVSQIVTLLSRDFIKLVLVANLVAIPIAWFVMHKWLQDFAFRIDTSWWIFALAGILALIIALVTVSFQAIKAALANPVKSLRTE